MRPFLVFLLVATSSFSAGLTAANDRHLPPVEDPSLVAVINRHIDAKLRPLGVQPAPNCSDAEFVRRLALDLLGRIPTTKELDAFLADQRHDKRQHLVDLWLGSEDHVQHFADLYDTLLMGRTDGGKYAQRKQHQWRSHVEQLVRDNRRWDDFVAETLLARPEDPKNGGAVWFLYERKDKHQAIAEAIAPAVFGIRIECAQCHDHPLAAEIEQRHYWGLVAFFNRGKNVNTKNGPRVRESAIGGFSEFADLTGDSQPNLLTFFQAKTIDEPRPKGDQKDDPALYLAPERPNEPKRPKFSRRERFVHEIVKDHPRLAPAAVNRVWAMLMARGIVHPFDEMDSEHPPSHPRLLAELASRFETNGFRLRPIVRAIVLSDAYQRSSLRPEGVDDPSTFAWYLERPLTAEQWLRSAQLAVRGQNAQPAPEVLNAFRKSLPDVLPDESISTVKEAMFLSNHPALLKYVDESVGEGDLPQRVLAVPPGKRAAVLFRVLFQRPPETSEAEAVEQYLARRKDRQPAAVRQIIWAMLTSAEFRLNH